jgi:hypothetical protein
MALLPIDIQLFAEGGEGNTNPNQNGGTNAEDGGNNPKTYTQEELDNIVNERTGRATKSALKSFFSQKGLSEEEANTAIGEYLDNKKKNTPDIAALQQSVGDERKEKLKAQLRAAGTLEAVKQGVSVDSIEYVLTLADYAGCTDSEGNIVSLLLDTGENSGIDCFGLLVNTKDRGLVESLLTSKIELNQKLTMSEMEIVCISAKHPSDDNITSSTIMSKYGLNILPEQIKSILNNKSSKTLKTVEEIYGGTE